MKPADNGIGAKDLSDGHRAETIKISVRLLANLKAYGPVDEDEFTLTVSSRETVAALIDRLHLPARLKPIVVVNGRPTKPTTRFVEGDRVLVFEPATGG